MCRHGMNVKRIVLAALAAVAVALFVEPAAAESTLRAATSWVTDPYCYYPGCEPTYNPQPSGSSLVDTVNSVIDTVDSIGESLGLW